MSILLRYKSKKELKEKALNQSRFVLRYSETSIFGDEVSDNCDVTGSNRPLLTGIKGREFFARLVIRNGIIEKIT
jgi:hypothetical protein